MSSSNGKATYNAFAHNADDDDNGNVNNNNNSIEEVDSSEFFNDHTVNNSYNVNPYADADAGTDNIEQYEDEATYNSNNAEYNEQYYNQDQDQGQQQYDNYNTAPSLYNNNSSNTLGYQQSAYQEEASHTLPVGWQQLLANNPNATLRPLNDLPGYVQHVFHPYQYFNPVQSECFNLAYYGHDVDEEDQSVNCNLVVSAPTGSY
jgi:hypothetical protein